MFRIHSVRAAQSGTRVVGENPNKRALLELHETCSTPGGNTQPRQTLATRPGRSYWSGFNNRLKNIMSKTSVICIATSEDQAINIVNRLKNANFSSNDISVLLPDKTGTKDFAHEQHTKAPEGATTGGITGGVLGGALGWLVGIGALAIPGVGPFIAAGPIMAALAGAGVGADAGGLTGALVGMGIPEYEAKRYEGKVNDGNILMSVHTRDSEERDRAKEIFKNAGAEDI